MMKSCQVEECELVEVEVEHKDYKVVYKQRYCSSLFFRTSYFIFIRRNCVQNETTTSLSAATHTTTHVRLTTTRRSHPPLPPHRTCATNIMRRARTLLLLLVTLLAVSSSLASRPRPSSSDSPSPSRLSQLKRAVGEKLRGAVGKAVSGAKNVAAEKPDDDTPDAAPETAKEANPGDERDRAIPDDGAHLHRRVLVESPLSPWIQPTTFLRVALLIIRNAALGNPAAGFLQSILTTELAYTAFTNVFASFAAAVVQDFSQVRGGRKEEEDWGSPFF